MMNNFRKLKGIFFNYLPNLLRVEIAKSIPGAYFRFRYAPQIAALNITDNCCFKCVMCSQWKDNTSGELSAEDWKRVLLQLKQIGIKVVSFAGGEPFLRKDIIDLMGYAKSIGLGTAVTTNGYLLDEEKIKDSIRAGIELFAISLDAVGDKFDEIRGIEGAYKKVINTCEILSQYKKKRKVEVHLYFTLMKNTLSVYQDVFSMARKFDFPLVVNLFDSTPYFFSDLKGAEHKFWIDEDHPCELRNFLKFIIEKKEKNDSSIYHIYSEIEYFRKYFKDPLQKDIPCSVSQKRLGIDSQGNVYGGCWSMGSFGSLKSSSLKDIVNSAEYKKAHKDMFFKKCPGCSCGYTTNLRHSVSVMAKELMFRLAPSLRKKIYV